MSNNEKDIKDLEIGIEACTEKANEKEIPMLVCFPKGNDSYHITGGGSDLDLVLMFGAMMECDQRFYNAAATALTLVTNRKIKGTTKKEA